MSEDAEAVTPDIAIQYAVLLFGIRADAIGQ